MDNQIHLSDIKKVTLEKNQVFSLKRSKEVHVISGELWLTHEGDAQDYFYQAGDKFVLPDGKHSVMQALGQASFWF